MVVLVVMVVTVVTVVVVVVAAAAAAAAAAVQEEVVEATLHSSSISNNQRHPYPPDGRVGVAMIDQASKPEAQKLRQLGSVQIYPTRPAVGTPFRRTVRSNLGSSSDAA